MHKAVLVILSFCWIALFSALSVVALTAASDGIGAAQQAMPAATPFLGIGPLASQPLMGGLSLGSAMVTALFAWMLLTALIVEDTASQGAVNPIELAHGGAFGIVGVIFLASLLDSTILIIASSGMLLASLVLSLTLSRMAPQPGPTLAPRHVRDRAIEAAHLYSVNPRQEAEILPFPLRGESVARGGR